MLNFPFDNKEAKLSMEIKRIAKIARKNSFMARTYVLIWSKMLYEIWTERCFFMYEIENYL